MTKKEILMMLNLLKVAYPNFYKNFNKEETEDTVILYEAMFKEFDGQIVLLAVKELINTFKYPPTIADIKDKIYQITNIKEKSDSELWECLLKAIRNGNYGSKEEFNRLPEIIKEYIRNPQQLQEMAQMDSDTIHSVVKGQFLKQIPILKQRQKEKNMMSKEVKELLENKYENLMINY